MERGLQDLTENELRDYVMSLFHKRAPAEHVEDVVEWLASRVTLSNHLSEEWKAWAPIRAEVERRAEKECCIEERCDFTVTVSHDEYVATQQNLTFATDGR